jgi:hypothetical protein
MSNRRIEDQSLASVPEEDLVDGMIHLTGARATDHVTIAGSWHIGLMTGLCRRGFGKVSCRAVCGPRIADEPADLLWIPEISSETALTGALAQLGRNLRPGGTLVVGDQRHGAAQALRRWLARNGFLPTQQIALPGAGGTLLAARKKDARDERQRAAA